MTEKSAPGFTRCETCGEFNGTTDVANLSGADGDARTGKVTVACLCSGIPCSGCKTHLVHKPTESFYDPASNSVRRRTQLGGETLCGDCRRKVAEEAGRRVVDVDAPLSVDADIMDLVKVVGMKEAAKLGAKFVEICSEGGTYFEVELYGRQFGPMRENELVWFLVALAAKPSRPPDFHAEASERSSEIRA